MATQKKDAESVSRIVSIIISQIVYFKLGVAKVSENRRIFFSDCSTVRLAPINDLTQDRHSMVTDTNIIILSIQGGAPPDISWFIIPINYRYNSHKP